MLTTVAEPKPETTDKKDAQPRSHIREGVETIAFVVTLVLLLKLFVVEAFVIPTGSMAETLYGYQKIVQCSQCKFEFPVNSHDEVEGNASSGRKTPLLGYTCPNCRYKGDFLNTDRPDNRSGDRVLVLKPIYHAIHPHRGDVVVFKYPKEPQDARLSAVNYIKRAMGFGGETIAIFRGELFTTRDLDYPADLKNEDGEPIYPRPENPFDAWRLRYMYSTAYNRNPLALNRFNETWNAGFPADKKSFEIIRKDDAQVLACKRIVWDNDFQPTSLKGVAKPRWQTDGAGWTTDDATQPRVFTHAGAEQQWLHYQHLIDVWSSNPAQASPSIIRNFLGYNSGEFGPEGQSRASTADKAWVGDLLLECDIEFSNDTEVVLELSRSIHRYQAAFASGTVTLTQAGKDAKTLATRPTTSKGSGKFTLRFANADSRLRVWVDGTAIDFGGEADYAPVMVKSNDMPNGGTEGWTKDNDEIRPASIGVKGAATVRKVRLFRDIFYCNMSGTIEPETPEVYYVQPGHYLCLGDNSAQSSDSRMWGTVPERLLLGKAVFVFWPFSIDRAKNRIGLIK